MPLLLACVFQQAAAQSGVSVYGVVDLAVVSDRDSGKAATGVNSGQQTASRLGLKGNEDLGGGMRASFVVESQIEADTGNPSFAGRPFGSQSWVGLSGAFGSVKLGRMFTPYFGAIATNDPFDADVVHKNDRHIQHASATQLALGYYYTLSKRTNLYLVGSNLRNGSAASYQATLAGGTRRLVAAGMRHQF
nr:porin [Duganella vulcania]